MTGELEQPAEDGIARSAKAVPWVLAEAVVTLGSSLLVGLFVASMIGATQFGLATLAVSIVTIGEPIVVLAFTESLIRDTGRQSVIENSALGGTLVIAIALTAILSAASGWIAGLYGAPELRGLLVVQSLTLLLAGFRVVPEAMLARDHQFRSLSLRGILAKSATAVVTIGLALNGFAAWSIILGNLAYAVFAAVMVWWVVPRVPSPRFDDAAIRGMLRFGAFSVTDSFLGGAVARVFAFLVGYYHGVSATGQIGMALRINDAILGLISSALGRMALPMMVVVSGDRERFRALYRTSTTIAFTAAAPVFVGLMLVSAPAVTLVLGPGWSRTSDMLIATSVFSCCYFACVLASFALKSLGRPERWIIVQLACLVWITVAVVATSPLGFDGAVMAWVGLGAVFLVTGLTVNRATTGIGYRQQLAPLGIPLACCAVMAAAVLALQAYVPLRTPLLAIAASAALGALVFLIGLLLLDRTLIDRLQTFRKTTRDG